MDTKRPIAWPVVHFVQHGDAGVGSVRRNVAIDDSKKQI